MERFISSILSIGGKFVKYRLSLLVYVRQCYNVNTLFVEVTVILSAAKNLSSWLEVLRSFAALKMTNICMSQRAILVGDQTIEYRVRRRRGSRYVRLTVNCDASVVVTVPWFVRVVDAERFIVQKAQWVLGRVEFFKTHTKQWCKGSSTNNYREHKAAAEALINTKIKQLNVQYNFSYGSVSVRNQKTRWGSCSRKGNLNFNYRLLFLDEALVEYVVVHELCHLAQLNHSAKFWALVEKTIPDYKNRRRELMKKRF